MAITFDIELPSGADQPELARADLTFYGLDHSGPSTRYASSSTTLTPDLLRRSPRTPVSPAGSRYSVTAAASGRRTLRDPGTRQRVRPAPAPPLAPAVRALTVTDAIRDLIQRDARTVAITAVPVVRPSPLADAEQAADVLVVDQVALHTFE